MAPSGPRNHHDRWRPVRRLAGPLEVLQVRWLGRSIVSLLARTPVLVLHTTGRRSGRERATPLAVLREADGALVVVGGSGGQARTPDWVANLRAHPNARVTLDRRCASVVAEEIVGDERTRLWSHLTTVWPRVAAYQHRAGRDIPVFRLRPTP